VPPDQLFCVRTLGNEVVLQSGALPSELKPLVEVVFDWFD
jgi:hypothetical protein